MNYNNITGEIVRGDNNKITYTIAINQETLKATINVQFYEKADTEGVLYQGIDILYVLINGTPLIINNPLFPNTTTSTSWTYINSGSTTIDYKKDGTLDLVLAITYKTSGSYPNSVFDENGYNIFWIKNSTTNVEMPVISAIQYKVNNAWKDVNSWFKVNGSWKHCFIWKKISGVWKKRG